MSYSAIDVPDFYEAASIRLISLGLADYTGQKRKKQGRMVHDNGAAQDRGDVTDNNSNALQVSKAPGSGALQAQGSWQGSLNHKLSNSYIDPVSRESYLCPVSHFCVHFPVQSEER